MNEDDPVRLDIRLSGQLRRYHTWPIIGQQTVAEHTWQILRIYCSIVDKIDPHMVMHAMFHDIGETFTGDLPYPVKSENRDLKKQLDYLEEQSRLRQLEYWSAFKQIFLSEEDKIFFKQIELIEMAEFGMDQMCLGNNHAFIIADRCLRKVYENDTSARLMRYIVYRLNIFHNQYKNTLNDALGDWWHVEVWHKKLTHGFKLEGTNVKSK
jgi:5'-deoxynucleotidase YfbR-like HD superfamily hydrolase